MRRLLRSAGTVLFAGALAVGCDRQQSAGPTTAPADRPATGVACEVQFRRELLGASGSGTPIGPLITTMNGASCSVKGKMVQITPEWLEVQTDDESVWIPRGNVLLIEYPKPSP